MKIKKIQNLIISMLLILSTMGGPMAGEKGKEKAEAVKSQPSLDVQFAKRIRGFGRADAQMQYPTNVSVDSKGLVYLADTGNHRIQIFSSDGEFLRSIGKYGREPGELSFPADVKVDKAGNIYVADMENHRIQVFDSEGNFVRQIGEMGKAPGYLLCPYGVEVDDEEGFLYIADTMAHRIQKFTTDGEFVTTWGEYGRSPGQFHFPRSVALTPRGELYVADAANNRIQVFTKEGHFLRMFGKPKFSLNWQQNAAEFQEGWGCPDAVAVVSIAAAGAAKAEQEFYIYFVDMLNHRIKVYDQNDSYIGSFGGIGEGPGKFFLPKGVAVDSKGNVWVTHSGTHTLDKFVDHTLRAKLQ